MEDDADGGRRLVARAAMVICLLTLGWGSSGQDLEDLSLEELMTVRVSTASTVEATFGAQPSSVTIVSRRQIELSGARTLSEVLMTYVPGYFLVEDQDDVIAGFRGFSPDNNSKVLLLLNGHPLNTEWFWGPSDAVLNGIVLDWIERIEVVRGPGSATLGPGALLGVINIITRDGSREETEIIASAGQEGLFGASIQYGSGLENATTAYIMLAQAQLDGQPIRNEGWAANRVEQGRSVWERGHHLKRSDNRTLVGRLERGDWELSILHADQQRDLYNFYRDREEVRQTITSAALTWRKAFGAGRRVTARLAGDIDDFDLASHSGVTMGGTREIRGSLHVIGNFDNIPNNRLALGVDVKHFDAGRKNRSGNNFILNDQTQRSPNDNETHTWAFPSSTSLVGVFAEDYWDLRDDLVLFGAFRLDRHPQWGSKFTPRLGVVWSGKKSHIRLSWQTGFRGAVGVHYSGGFLRDGLLREDNFHDIENNETLRSLGFSNLSPTKPEEISSFELAGNHILGPSVSVDGVLFYNEVRNVIDVGVIFVDPSVASIAGQPVGSDLVGDWNGLFYFKNNPGTIGQIGVEATLRWRKEPVDLSISHAHVEVREANAEQLGGSMYLTGTLDDPHFKAYPEDVTRVNLMLLPSSEPWSASINYLYDWRWYSPAGQRVDGSHLVSATVSWAVTSEISLSLIGRNLLDSDELYPMNNNASDAVLSPGTPALESRTFWLRAGYRF